MKVMFTSECRIWNFQSNNAVTFVCNPINEKYYDDQSDKKKKRKKKGHL